MPITIDISNNLTKLKKTVKFDKFEWKFKIEIVPNSHQVRLFLESTPEEELESWDVILNFINPQDDSEVSRRRRFTMCDNIALIATKGMIEFTGCKVEIDVKAIKYFEPIVHGKLTEPTPRFTNAKLIAGGQVFYVCKKILAQKSTLFFELFYGEGSASRQLEYDITNVNPQEFNLFMTLLCHNEYRIPREHFRGVAELAKKFGAKQCARECEKWLIKVESMTGQEKLELAEGLGYTVLEDYVLMQLKTPKEVDSINSRFDFALEEKLIKRKNELDGERSTIVPLKKEVMYRIHKIPFRFSCSPDEHGRYEVTIDCNWEDTSNPWKCDVSIACIHNGLSYGPRTYNFDWLNSRIKFTKLASKVRITDICFAGTFPEQTIDFGVPREKLFDVELEIGDKKFYASKQILANASFEFNEMFFSNDTDKKMGQSDEEIASPAGFDELLQHIYFPDRNMTEDKIEGLLRLSEKLKITRIKNKCEQILLHENSISEIMRLKLWQMYFPDSLKSLIVTFRTFKDLEMLSKMDGFRDLKPEIISAITLAIADSDKAGK